MREVKPSSVAFNIARQLAREAAEDDHWMTPLPEEHMDEGDAAYISAGHRESWQQTTHFELRYSHHISDVCDTEERRLTEGRFDMDGLVRYEGLFIPLLDAFWDEWEALVGFYEKLDEARTSYATGG